MSVASAPAATPTLSPPGPTPGAERRPVAVTTPSRSKGPLALMRVVTGRGILQPAISAVSPSASPRPTMSAAPSTVLLVEDNEDNRIIYATYLRHRGFRVVLASTGEEGIALATAERPDVVLMDMTMPGIDGYEATAILKQDPRTAHIPVVALTAHASAEHEARAAAAGCAAYLRKPIEPGAVVAEVARWAPPPRSSAPAA